MKSTVIMVQGTTSDAGKSVLVAGICRYLARQGVSVAPFKPQNMALNSAVTPCGGEIGRAQAVQAQAAMIEPTVDMNPVLLKPTTDRQAQVIVQGKVHSQLDALKYQGHKAVLMPYVLESFQRLKSEFDVVVVEGAGSPAEINLRENDIANMGFAEAVDCPVIIVADIDRGGVFAHLVGTIDVLSGSEQQRILGFVINRFRGDISLLEPGLDWLEERTQKLVYGVLPYIHGLHIEAEDAIKSENTENTGELNVVVPVLPRISNHTDFDVLRLHPQVNLQFVGPEEPHPPADLIILPGSKSVMKDLEWLRHQGWDKTLQRHLRYGGKVIGICGGYQMLGTVIKDPLGVESDIKTMDGLGWLPLQTELAPDKTLTKVSGQLFFALDSAPTVDAIGYEIHAGETTIADTVIPLLKQGGGSVDGSGDGSVDGCVNADENILGTYWHGLFDHSAACNALLSWAGVARVDQFDYETMRERAFDQLADEMEAHLELERLVRDSGAFGNNA